jgi:hypothetical protein
MRWISRKLREWLGSGSPDIQQIGRAASPEAYSRNGQVVRREFGVEQAVPHTHRDAGVSLVLNDRGYQGVTDSNELVQGDPESRQSRDRHAASGFATATRSRRGLSLGLDARPVPQNVPRSPGLCVASGAGPFSSPGQTDARSAQQRSPLPACRWRARGAERHCPRRQCC